MKTNLSLALLTASTLLAPIPAHAAPEGTWKAIGQGQWHEDLLTVYDPALAHSQWTVPVEQSDADPAWYRVAPYAVESEATSTLDTTDNTYIYINTTDPSKVYIEDFTLCDGKYEFTQLVPECGWRAHDRYATLAEGIITWPRISVRTSCPDLCIYDSNTCPNGELALVLPTATTPSLWTSIGRGTFTDGICCAFLTGAAETHEVEIEERSDRPGYYRITQAWRHHATVAEPLVIDATDPDFVTLPFQPTGLTFPEYGEANIASVGATYVHEDGITKEEFISRSPEMVIKMKNGVIEIPENAVVFNFPSFNWLKFYGAEHPAKSYIRLAGGDSLEKVEAATGEDAATYYNLQGQPVAHPAQGSVVIEIRDGHARKVRL